MPTKGPARWAVGDGSKSENKKSATPKLGTPKLSELVLEERPPKPVIQFQWLLERPKTRPEKDFEHVELPDNESKPVPMTLEREIKKAPPPNLAATLKKAEDERLDKLQFCVVTEAKEQLRKEDATDVQIVRYMYHGFSKTAVSLALALHGTSDSSEKAVIQFCEKFDALRKKEKLKPFEAFRKIIEEGISKGQSQEKAGAPVSSFVVPKKEETKSDDKAKNVTGKLQLQVAGVVYGGAHSSAAKQDGDKKEEIIPYRPYPHAYISAYPNPPRVISNSVDLRRYNCVPGADFRRYGL